MYAYGNNRIMEGDKTHKTSVLKATYCFLNRSPNFIAIICFTKWRRYVKGLRRWKSFKFWHYSTRAEHVSFSSGFS